MKPARTLIDAFCITALLFAQCKKEDKPYQPIQICSDLSYDIDTIKLYIQGNWQWLENKWYNFDSRDYAYRTPKTEGYVKYMSFTGNSASVHSLTSIANTIIATYIYKIQRESEITNFPEDTNAVLVLYNRSTGQRESYFRVAICKNFLITARSYRSDGEGDDTWKRF
jgi:hypothetical protein